MKTLISGAIAVAALLAAGSASAQTATASASVTIVLPVTVTKTTDLTFGTIAPSTSAASTVTMTAAGTESATGGAHIFTSGAAAAFAVAGNTGASYGITIPAGPVVLTDGTHTINLTPVGSKTTGTLSGTPGADTFTVGGSLALAMGQAAGAYTNTTDLTVTVAYQ